MQLIDDIAGNSTFRWLAISLFVSALERFLPWRKRQRFGRPEILQDVFWFAFNGYLLWLVAGPVFHAVGQGIDWAWAQALDAGIRDRQLLAGLPLWAQVAIALPAVDFVEWLVHNLLHRAPFLWKIHRVHHSIRVMDWWGNFRFHPLEILVYHSLKYVPLALLGASGTALAITGGIALLIGNLNHANLDISWGPLRYVLNSPRMHIWHHEAELRGRAGTNFGIVLSLWDWIFRTAYMPREAVPDRLGFGGDDRFPSNLLWRFFLPFLDRRRAG